MLEKECPFFLSIASSTVLSDNPERRRNFITQLGHCTQWMKAWQNLMSYRWGRNRLPRWNATSFNHTIQRVAQDGSTFPSVQLQWYKIPTVPRAIFLHLKDHPSLSLPMHEKSLFFLSFSLGFMALTNCRRIRSSFSNTRLVCWKPSTSSRADWKTSSWTSGV